MGKKQRQQSMPEALRKAVQNLHVKPKPDVTGVTADEWKEHAQSFELAWWQDSPETRKMRHHPKDDPQELDKLCSRNEDGHRQLSGVILKSLGFTQRQFANQKVLEIGCGPTGRTLWFEDVYMDAIEPLADELRELPWAQFGHFGRVYAEPVEEFLAVLEGKYDAVISLNCLDHCYDLETALANIYCYLMPGGSAFLSFDVNKPKDHDPTHPICVSHRTANTMMKDAGFRVAKVACGHCYPDPEGGWLDNWGGGTAWHWWLEKPAETETDVLPL